jgi:cell division transport system permease protein
MPDLETKPIKPVEKTPEDADHKQHSIVPRSSVSGSTLTLVVAIMAFLASLTLGAVWTVNDTAQSWQNDVSREITVQVRPVDGVDLDTALISARQIVGSYPGVRSVDVVDNVAMAALLEPWLGGGLNLEELPVPRLVSVSINESNPPDMEAMAAQLKANVPGASLDNHRAWIERLTTMARTTILTGLLIFVLMMIATVLTVVFATRGAMAGSKHIIEVLHFVGAEQSYIATQFQKHFLFLGLRGALAGGFFAIVFFLFVGWWASGNPADPTSNQVEALFGTFGIGIGGYLSILLLIFIISVLTALTSRFTVLRHVGTLDRSSGDG